MNQDQLKQHINNRLEGTRYHLESAGDALVFISDKNRETLILGGDDYKNEVNATKFLLRLIGPRAPAPPEETELDSAEQDDEEEEEEEDDDDDKDVSGEDNDADDEKTPEE